MKYRWRMHSIALVPSLLVACGIVNTQHAAEIDWSTYTDVLDMHYRDCDGDMSQCSLFVDNGAWHAYALPADSKEIGFPGPYLLTRDFGYWLKGRFGAIQIVNSQSGRKWDIADAAVNQWSEPGRLRQIFVWADLQLDLNLIFSDSRTAAVEIRIENTASSNALLTLVFSGQKGAETATLTRRGTTEILTTFSDSAALVTTSWHAVGAKSRISADGYSFSLDTDIALVPGEIHRTFLTQASFIDEGDFIAAVKNFVAFSDLSDAFLINRQRWGEYIARVNGKIDPAESEIPLRRLAVKAIQTLIGNWRGPAKDLKYDGIYPSYAVRDFNGVWSWDTWKQAVATAYFDPELARNLIRGMLHYQNSGGMVADAVYYDKIHNNWRDTKPPLAAWSVWSVYESDRDLAFLEEMYPKLKAYHDWWYADRDHDQDGLAEFGSTDGTRIAAAWESGMDNAVRFDNARIVKNSATAWSFDQESVDLNAYLYAEKQYLALIAVALNERISARTLADDAKVLRSKIQSEMFDESDGFFYDISIDGSRKIRVQGPEGWSPLWTGVATEEQAERVIKTMRDPARFATFMPFPTLAADHSEFEPDGGYWRGPVWIDQAYFAVLSLQRFGREDLAQLFRQRLIYNAQGLLDQSPIYENYVPGSGKGIEAPHFSWSAAHYLMLLADFRQPEHGK